MLRTSLVLAALLAPSLWSQSQWTDLGCPIDGVAGPPLLTGSGDITLGSSNSLELTSAAPNALAIPFVSFSLNEVPFKGGTLKVVPALPIPPFTTSPTGGLSIPFTWSEKLPGSTIFFVQCAIADGAAVHGVALSNALRAVSAGPQPVIDAVEPLFIAPGTSVTVDAVNLGEEPLDVFVQLVSDEGEVLGRLITDAIDGDGASASLAFAEAGVTAGRLAVATGAGGLYQPPSTLPGVEVGAAGIHVWGGYASDFAVSDQTLSVGAPLATYASLECTTYEGTVNALNYLEVRIPNLICEPGSEVYLDIFVYTESGQLYCSTVFVPLEITTALPASLCALELGSLVEDAFMDFHGLDINPLVIVEGGDVCLIFPPADSSDPWLIDSSETTLTICAPAPVPECQSASASQELDAVVVTVPQSIPQDAGVGALFTITAGGWPYVVGAFASMDGSTTPSECAEAVATALNQALSDEGLFFSAYANDDAVVVGPLGFGGDARLTIAIAVPEVPTGSCFP